MNRRKFLQRIGLLAVTPVVAKVVPEVVTPTVVPKVMPRSAAMTFDGLTAAAPSISFTADCDTGFYLDDANSKIMFSTGGVDSLVLDLSDPDYPSKKSTMCLDDAITKTGDNHANDLQMPSAQESDTVPSKEQ